jgi:tetratricopeptide (TPR) repeat protein
VEGALADLDRAVELADDPGIRFNRATALQELGRYAEAVDEYDRVLAATDDPDARHQRAVCNLRLGRRDWHLRWSAGATDDGRWLLVGTGPPSHADDGVAVRVYLSQDGAVLHCRYTIQTPDTATRRDVEAAIKREIADDEHLRRGVDEIVYTDLDTGHPVPEVVPERSGPPAEAVRAEVP